MTLARKARSVLAVSMGDPAGIGAEIILKSAAEIAHRRRAPSIVVVGDLRVMSETAARLRGVPEPREWKPGEAPARLDHGISVLAASDLSRMAGRPGRPTVEGGEASFDYVVRGARMTMRGEADALVTAPISKEWWHRAGHRYPGHSELVAEIGGVRRWRMMFAGDELKLALVTVHMALKRVSAVLTRRAVLDTIRLLEAHLRERLGVARPRIGVLGFNPHAGEKGLFGDEEIRTIVPAIRAAQREGIDAFGPLAPDTAFIRPKGRFNFDAAVAMYHDQGLIALKTLEFDRAVNVTLGLPFIRTSPDHGTAFDLAGKGPANPSSMLAAIDYAWRAAEARGARRVAA
ncbi:MAG: 4-hydroxythreonine-4-phosphate dehydrogenase PdxA [Candidatus Binataceae bacterium]